MVIHFIIVTGKSYIKTFLLQIHEFQSLDYKKFIRVVTEIFVVRNSYQGTFKLVQAENNLKS